MKKFVKRLSRLLMCILCVACLSGCSNQPKLTTVDEVVQALKDAGYTDAYHESGSTTVYLSSDDAEHINFCNLSWIFDNLDESKLYVSSSEYHSYKFPLFNIDKEKDYSKVLDAIMPFFDSEYDHNGSEIINQLLEYEEQEEFSSTYKSGLYFTKDIVYERDGYTVTYYLSDGDKYRDINIKIQ